ncbi:alpha/beta hydrolase [Pseudochryseolinea flava]|uniref:Peptide methionine sulfoxide reductase n=1 Tax=Pseudochryseolinea flava TaxID=2059302 RepID=A0A364Y4Q7_9BACT|nr:alpha/beta hydrolase-fold protein [Pseudochryseolinea flava]RAW00817.1 peptide methionine sulfoxide reductase [Pseudochryseolinea flava]
MQPLKLLSLSIAMLVCHYAVAQTADVSDLPRKGKLLTEIYSSTILKENRLGIDTKRSIKVYLPAGYDHSNKRYPVIYFLHNIFWNNDQMFEDGRVVTLMDRAIVSGVMGEFIMVVPDYKTATTGSLYENSPVSGRWLDHTTDEIVPFIDKKFRTIPHQTSRAVVGEFMGGRGALKLAMTRPDIFSVAYALHPVATGMGELPWAYLRINWQKLFASKSYPDQSLEGIEQIFLSVSQAFLPNEKRPPLYCDFFMEMVNNTPTLLPDNVRKAREGFLLDESLDACADNLRKLSGIALDWGRFDPTYAHVDSNREFSRKLEDLGIEHEAEEYRGNPYDKVWLEDGRFYTRVLPFLAKHLIFAEAASVSK